MFTNRSLVEGGARLYPRCIATTTPQHFTGPPDWKPDANSTVARKIYLSLKTRSGPHSGLIMGGAGAGDGQASLIVVPAAALLGAVAVILGPLADSCCSCA